MTGMAIGMVLVAGAGWLLLELAYRDRAPQPAGITLDVRHPVSTVDALPHTGATEAWSPLAEVTAVPELAPGDVETTREHLRHDAAIAAELTRIEGELSAGLDVITRWAWERLRLDAGTLLNLAGVKP